MERKLRSSRDLDRRLRFLNNRLNLAISDISLHCETSYELSGDRFNILGLQKKVAMVTV